MQAAVEQVLYGGMKIMNAKGASAVLMNVHTGEVDLGGVAALVRSQRPAAPADIRVRSLRQPAFQPLCAGGL